MVSTQVKEVLGFLAAVAVLMIGFALGEEIKWQRAVAEFNKPVLQSIAAAEKAAKKKPPALASAGL